MVKDRDIPISEFLDKLQKEYLVAEIRHRIYPKLSDKSFWEKVMFGKKCKIEDICFRNNIDSIFTSEEQKKRLYTEVYNEKGLPNFLYKDDNQKHGVNGYPGLLETDIAYYYTVDMQVRVDEPEKERKFGKITGYTLNRELILVEIEGKEFEVESKYVTRII